MYDVAIVGAGPAGATLSRLIGKKYKVLIVDKRQLDKPYDGSGIVKCCGGLVAPDAQKILAELGLGLPDHVLAGPQLFAVRTIDLKNSIERYYQRFYINIDREKFDRWLVSLIPEGVDSRFGCMFKSYIKKQDYYEISLMCNGVEYIERARILVAADGAFSNIRRQAIMEHVQPKVYVSIQEWFDIKTSLPYFSAIFDDEITDFYSWTIPKGDFLIVGSALQPGESSDRKFELLKRKLNAYGMNFEKRIKREGAFILRPESLSHVCAGKDDIMLVGEAGGWISPSSAEGLSYAFRSALALAKSLGYGPENCLNRYRVNMHSIKRNIVLKNLKLPFMYNPWLRNLVMRSGIQSIDTGKGQCQ